jgi:hypothetical protein
MLGLFVYVIFFVLIILVGIIFGYYRYTNAKKKVITQNNILLKKEGHKITVDLDSCEILHREYYERGENGQIILKDISVLRYIVKIDGENVSFLSNEIYLSKLKLLNKLTDQKFTAIYFDPVNVRNYYFDLEFILEYLI